MNGHELQLVLIAQLRLRAAMVTDAVKVTICRATVESSSLAVLSPDESCYVVDGPVKTTIQLDADSSSSSSS